MGDDASSENYVLSRKDQSLLALTTDEERYRGEMERREMEGGSDATERSTCDSAPLPSVPSPPVSSIRPDGV